MSIAGRNDAFDPLSHGLWDPFDSFSFGQILPFPSDNSDLSMACIDWKETPKSHVLKMDLPGMKKQDVKLEVEGNIIHVSGERSGESHDENVTWHLVERITGKFMRSFRLPEDAKIDQIKASMENGVLTVTVPKEEVKKRETKSRPIEIEGGQGGVLSRLKVPSLFKPKKT